MANERYVVNSATDAVALNTDKMLFKTLQERFFIKGDGMALALQEVLKCFEKPSFFEEAIKQLADKYSERSLKKLIRFLIEKHLLIEYDEYERLLKHDVSYLEKTFFYSAWGKPLQQIFDELKILQIGIVGTHQITNHLFTYLADSRLLKNFQVGITDDDTEIASQLNSVEVMNYDVYNKPQNIQKIIENCDYIFAASNYNDHRFFTQINVLCYDDVKNWMRIVNNGYEAEVGPIFKPGKTCCYACLLKRKDVKVVDEEYIFNDLYKKQITQMDSNEKALKFSTFYPLNSISANIACTETIKFFAGVKTNLMNQVLLINGMNYHTQTDYIYKDYKCPVCIEGCYIA